MNKKYSYNILGFAIAIVSIYTVYRLGKLYFLPVWNGGLEDKKFITICLIATTIVALIAIEQSLNMLANNLKKISGKTQIFHNISVSIAIKSILFPFKSIALLFSVPLAYQMWDSFFGFLLSIIITYVYLDKMPEINKKLLRYFSGKSKAS